VIQAPHARLRARDWLPPVALLLGVGLGIGAGLAVSWWLWPVEYVDVAPDSLRPIHRNEYVLLIAQAYTFDGDRQLAKARLSALGDVAAVGPEVATLAEQFVAERRQTGQTEALIALARALGQERPALVAYRTHESPVATWTPLPSVPPLVTPTGRPTETPTRMPTHTPTPLPTATSTATATPTPLPTATATATATPTPTYTPAPTQTPTRRVVRTAAPTGLPQPRDTVTTAPSPTPQPTHTPTPLPGPRFVLRRQEQGCDPPGGLLRVWVRDADGEPMPNVELLLRWEGGQERFYTGLKPEIGAGYADSGMEKGIQYQLSVVGWASDVALGLDASPCADSGHAASWDVAFQLTGVQPLTPTARAR